MTIQEIKKSSWARRFRKAAPSSYARALEYALEETLLVSIVLRNDLDREKPLWAVVVDEPHSGDEDFWMDAFKRKEDAEKLCNKMGWTLQ